MGYLISQTCKLQLDRSFEMLLKSDGFIVLVLRSFCHFILGFMAIYKGAYRLI